MTGTEENALLKNRYHPGDWLHEVDPPTLRFMLRGASLSNGYCVHMEGHDRKSFRMEGTACEEKTPEGKGLERRDVKRVTFDGSVVSKLTHSAAV